MKNKLLIVMQGGMIQSIASTTPVEIVVNDYDNDEENQIYGYNVDAFFKEGEAFQLIDREASRSKVPLSSAEILIKEHLKDIKF